MATVEQGVQAAQIRNIEAAYGKPMPGRIAIISASGLTRHTDVVAMLKKDCDGRGHRDRSGPGPTPVLTLPPPWR